MASKVVHNFGKNVSFTPAVFAEPKSEEEVLQLLKQHRDLPIRVVASRHAWSEAIQTEGLLISVEHLNHVRVNKQQLSVRVGAGCQIKDLLPQLKKQGLTLPSLGLIDEQTVAGATATGTHGSGKNSLSQYVRAIRVAHYDPQTNEPVISEIDGGTDLLAARCSLGLLGVILELEMEARSTYQVQEHSRRHESLESTMTAEKEYPLQQFFLMPWSWDLYGQHRRETEQDRSRTAGLYRVYWHLFIDWSLHLIMFLLVKILRIPALIQGFYRFLLPLVFVRKWRVTDDSHRMLTMQHELFRHIEIEFFVSRSNLKAALDEVKQTIKAFAGHTPDRNLNEPIPDQYSGSYSHHYPICVRRVLADDTLISMSSPRTDDNDEDWYAISLISYEWPSRREGFFNFAQFLAFSLRSRFNARCHWGKYNPLDREANEKLYPKLNEFREVVQRFDPDSRFANQWLREVLLKDGSEDATGDDE